MPITLMVRSADQSASDTGHKLTFDGPRIVIGRSAGCDVRIPDESVSVRHAIVRPEGAGYVVVDEGSTNGTFVGGVRVAANTSRVVRTGDLVRVGRVWLEVRIDHAPITRDLAAATRDLAFMLVSNALREVGEDIVPCVRVVEGRDQGTTLRLVEEGRIYTIGRGNHCDLSIADADASREHVQITRRGSITLIRDTGSKNGAVVGEMPVSTTQGMPWRPTLMVRIGRTVLALEEPVSAALAHIEEAPDAPILPSESFVPPSPSSSAVPASTAPKVATIPPTGLPSSDSARPAAPIAQLKEGPPAKRSPKRGGWTVVDFFVLVIALAILGLSVAALLWLLRG